MDCRPLAPLSVGILQARILEWVAIPFSRASSWPRDRTQVSCVQADSLPSEPPGKKPPSKPSPAPQKQYTWNSFLPNVFLFLYLSLLMSHIESVSLLCFSPGISLVSTSFPFHNHCFNASQASAWQLTPWPWLHHPLTLIHPPHHWMIDFPKIQSVENLTMTFPSHLSSDLTLTSRIISATYMPLNSRNSVISQGDIFSSLNSHNSSSPTCSI